MSTQTRQVAAVFPQATGTTLAHLVSYLHARGDDLPVDQALGMAIDAWLAAEQLRAAGGAASGYQWKCLFLPDGTHVRMRYKGLTEYAVVAGDTLLYKGRSVSPRGMTLAIAGEGRNAWSALMVRRPGDAHWQHASALRARIDRAQRQAQTQTQAQAPFLRQAPLPPQSQIPSQSQLPSQSQIPSQSQLPSQAPLLPLAQLPPHAQAQLQAQPHPQPQPHPYPYPHLQPDAASHADSLATAARCMSDALRSAMAVVDHMNAQAALHQDERRSGRCRRESDRHPDDGPFE